MDLQREFPFLRALCQQADERVSLVYADWLEERGDERTEFVRLQLALRQLPRTARRRRQTLQKQLAQLSSKFDPLWTELLSWSQWQPPEVRFDLAQVQQGPGVIEVRRGNIETVLLVEGQPIGINWDDCEGSIAQYLVLTGHGCPSAHVRQLRDFVAGEPALAPPLAEQLAPLLALCAPGIYTLAYTPAHRVKAGVVRCESSTPLELRDSNMIRTQQTELLQYYPEDHNLVCTQQRASLVEGRVAFFRKQIRLGHRPVVLTISAHQALCEFVIDGHHKLEAYQREQINPALLGLTHWNPRGLTREETLRYFPTGHKGIQAYRGSKARTVRERPVS